MNPARSPASPPSLPSCENRRTLFKEALDAFAVIFRMDVTFKPTGARSKMDEVATYTVADGRIVEERFYY